MTIIQARKVLESKMTDLCNIYRRKSITIEDGTTEIILDPTPVVANSICRISFIRYKVENPSDIQLDENPIEATPKVFLPVFTDVKAGDTLVLRRMSTEGKELISYSGITGMPAMYDTHIEVMLNVDTNA